MSILLLLVSIGLFVIVQILLSQRNSLSLRAKDYRDVLLNVAESSHDDALRAQAMKVLKEHEPN